MVTNIQAPQEVVIRSFVSLPACGVRPPTHVACLGVWPRQSEKGPGLEMTKKQLPKSYSS